MEILRFLFQEQMGWGVTFIILLIMAITPAITYLNNLADRMKVTNAERMMKARQEAAQVYAQNAEKLAELHAAQCVLLDKLTVYRHAGGNENILLPTPADLKALYDATPDASTEDHA